MWRSPVSEAGNCSLSVSQSAYGWRDEQSAVRQTSLSTRSGVCSTAAPKRRSPVRAGRLPWRAACPSCKTANLGLFGISPSSQRSQPLMRPPGVQLRYDSSGGRCCTGLPSICIRRPPSMTSHSLLMASVGVVSKHFVLLKAAWQTALLQQGHNLQ